MSTPNDPLNNVFRKRLLKHQPLIGSWLSLGSPITTEVMGVAGFDWLLFDLEHAPNDVLSLVPQLMALKDSTSAAVVRPPSNDTVSIKRLLDVGCHNFLIPFVESVEQARAAVAATRYPPQGVRGVSVSQRSNRYGSVTDYFKRINDQISVVVQIENPLGVEAAAEIAAIDGVDALFVGPSDLAASYGHLGNAAHAEVQAAIRSVHEAAAKANKASGILAPVEADARRYLAMGMSLVAVGSDLGLLRMNSQALADRFLRNDAQALAAQY
jgi:2-dehydro-3-deoxyglucarate aldolase